MKNLGICVVTWICYVVRAKPLVVIVNLVAKLRHTIVSATDLGYSLRALKIWGGTYYIKSLVLIHIDCQQSVVGLWEGIDFVSCLSCSTCHCSGEATVWSLPPIRGVLVITCQFLIRGTKPPRLVAQGEPEEQLAAPPGKEQYRPKGSGWRSASPTRREPLRGAYLLYEE